MTDDEGGDVSEATVVPEGAPCWCDLWTSDVAASRRFYAALFDWEAQEPSAQFGGYFMFTRHGVPVAGAMGDMGVARADDQWKLYLSTPDVSTTVTRAEDAGARVTVAPVPVADLGVQAVLVDPTGATLGAWQPGTFAGFSTRGEHGTPAWFQLHTNAVTSAVEFYRRVFRLDAQVVADTPDVRSTTLTSGGLALAGILEVTVPTARWFTYWYVDDIDVALARVTSLGGGVIDGPLLSPYGPIATVSDPCGARFKLSSAS